MEENKRLEIPVLLIAFNRPDNARAVLERIREAKPRSLYMAVDGPRADKPEDKGKCEACRSLISLVDWDCEVHTLFREENVGCGFGPSGAITWAFETTDRLIILEDDCLPSLSFFSFCEGLLQKYENDKRVWIISGLSIHPCTKFFGEYDYLFSHYAHTWGWATWKNRWEQFDMYMKDVPSFINQKIAYDVYDSRYTARRVNRRLRKVFDNIEQEVKHSWDTQWDYTRIKNNSCDIVPRINLITNIGDVDGTHTSKGSSASRLKIGEFSGPLSHPKFVVRNKRYDIYHYQHYIHPSFVKQLMRCFTNFAYFKYLIQILLKKIR